MSNKTDENTALTLLKKDVKNYGSYKKEHTWLTQDVQASEKLYCRIYSSELTKENFEEWVDENFPEDEIDEKTKKKLKSYRLVNSGSYQSYDIDINAEMKHVHAKFFSSFAKKLNDGTLEVGVALAKFNYDNVKNIAYYSGKSNDIVKGLKYKLYEEHGQENK